ncbi:MAG: glycoside hydrolase family 3 N-terminal domain-containing protein [Pseudomonadota bacterium]
MTFKRRQFLASAGALAGLAALPPLASAAAQPLYKNAGAPVAARVRDLLARMTLEEKLMQLQCVWKYKDLIQDSAMAFSAPKASQRYPHGLGMLARPSDRHGSTGGDGVGDSGARANRGARETAEYCKAAQQWAREQTRLGIPLILHEEALHGYAARDATCFPQAIAMASSFDPAMITQVYAVAAREMHARGANLALAPVVDVARDPRWGRIEETFGEDAFVCGEMGKAAVLGLMGDALPLAPGKVMATLKHLTGHGQPENGTNVGPASMGERQLREDFFPPFERIIRETRVNAVMPSYNEVDGLPSHANRWMLTDVMRKEWGFKGVTVSDYAGISSLAARHKLARDIPGAAVLALKAGVDIETPDSNAYAALGKLVSAGAVSRQEIDEAVRRVLTVKFEAGLFEAPHADPELAEARTADAAAVALARRAAGRCAVLLKNDKGLLPLDPKKVGRLLVLGTHARDCPLGGYSDIPRHVVSILDGLQAEGKRAGFAVAYAEGVRITEERIWGQDAVNFSKPEVNARLRAEALAAAHHADTILMVLGDNEQTSREAWADNHLGDRDNLDLIGEQNALAEAIFKLGKPTVVFFLNGRPLSANMVAQQAGAIIEGWYLGQETGHAAADLLFGRVNPGGKLPVSVARHVGQLPIFYNHKPSARRGYLAGTTKPLYPFGFGLSYTTFAVSAPKLERGSIGIGESLRVDVEVRNTGSVAGDEVVQLYVRDDVSSVTRPVLSLKAFERVTLEPGQSRTVSFRIGPDQLSFYNAGMRRVVEPGTFTLFSGPDSVNLKSTQLSVG